MHKITTQRKKGPRRGSGSFRQSPYDCIIIGAGAAGLSAGIFAARRGLSVLIISADVGGQTASTAEIENYPGQGTVEGPDLIAKFYQDAQRFGGTFLVDTIERIEKEGDIFLVTGSAGQYMSTAVIVASGKSPRKLGVPGEHSFIGRGIAYGSASNVINYGKRRVAVIGGGNSAMDAVSRLADHASHVTSIHRGSAFTGEKILLDRVQNISGLDCFFHSHVVALSGSDHLEGIEIVDDEGKRRTLYVDEVIVAIGFEARNEWVKNMVACDEMNHIIVDHECRTNCDGLFAAGDCTTVPYQQIVISAGEGAKAAISAYHYLTKKTGKRAMSVDWGFRK